MCRDVPEYIVPNERLRCCGKLSGHNKFTAHGLPDRRLPEHTIISVCGNNLSKRKHVRQHEQHQRANLWDIELGHEFEQDVLTW